jgi:hypothetical protein
MTNTVSTPGAVAWQRMGRVTGVAGLAAVVLIFVPIVVGMRTEPAFTATATEFLTYYKSPTQHAWRPVPVFRLHRWVGHLRLVRRRTDHLAAAC